MTMAAMAPNTLPMMPPTEEPGEEEVYLSGLLNSQLKLSTSRQKASLMSSLLASLGSMADRRLLVRVALGDAEIVASSGLLGSEVLATR